MFDKARKSQMIHKSDSGKFKLSCSRKLFHLCLSVETSLITFPV
jgi:hypothetical protein